MDKPKIKKGYDDHTIEIDFRAHTLRLTYLQTASNYRLLAFTFNKFMYPLLQEQGRNLIQTSGWARELWVRRLSKKKSSYSAIMRGRGVLDQPHV